MAPKASVLVVDDSSSMRFAVTSTLKDAGYEDIIAIDIENILEIKHKNIFFVFGPCRAILSS